MIKFYTRSTLTKHQLVISIEVSFDCFSSHFIGPSGPSVAESPWNSLMALFLRTASSRIARNTWKVEAYKNTNRCWHQSKKALCSRITTSVASSREAIDIRRIKIFMMGFFCGGTWGVLNLDRHNSYLFPQ